MAALDALPDLSGVSTVQGFSAVLVYSILMAFTLIVLHRIIAYVTMDPKTLGDASKGHDTPIIENAWTHKQVLSNVHMSNNDLAKDLPRQGVERPGARLEGRGKLYVIKK